jgi:hypothetical protein
MGSISVHKLFGGHVTPGGWKLGVRVSMVAALLLCPFAIKTSPAVAAPEPHAFNSALSLTGNCSESKVDPIPDPGLCPIPPGTRFGEEGVTEPDHPSGPFLGPHDVTTDAYGNIYVVNGQIGYPFIEENSIYVFNPDGYFITEIPDLFNAQRIAVDSEGVLYLAMGRENKWLSRYVPSVYEPEAGKIEYGNAPETIINEPTYADVAPIAVNPINDHLFVLVGGTNGGMREFSSASEGNDLLSLVKVALPGGTYIAGGGGLAIDAVRGRIYIPTLGGPSGEEEGGIAVLELDLPHNVLMQVAGSQVPGGKFLSGGLGVAVDEGTGNFFAFDQTASAVYEFDESGGYVGAIKQNIQGSFWATLDVDNGAQSPNGAENSRGRVLFVPSGGANGRLFAFGPRSEGPPEVEATSVTGISDSEAFLEATVNPYGLATDWSFEYTTQEAFKAEGFAGAVVAAEGHIQPGDSGVAVAVGLSALAPGTSYRFRIIAGNEEGSDEAVRGFATYRAPESFGGCPNEPLRNGSSSLLPDCRAYELVTPPDTSGKKPFGGTTKGGRFATRLASPDGEKFSFHIEGGTLAGGTGTGSLGGDLYLSSRGTQGWSTASAGPGGAETAGLNPGSISPDQGYSFWQSTGPGSASVEGKSSDYVRYPDGHSEFIGRGSLGSTPGALGLLISENGSHIIFSNQSDSFAPAKLEPNAPEAGTVAIYDRTPDEVTHVVSLLPGDITPAPGEDAAYLGASPDGRGVAFRLKEEGIQHDVLYLRYDDQTTYAIGEDLAFAGIAEGGSRIFYLQEGNLFARDVISGQTIPFSSGGEVTPVNIAADGTAAYFVSPNTLTAAPNPLGATAETGEQNLYFSREGQISFVGVLTERDVVGKFNGSAVVEGLGLWMGAVGSGELARDPSRSSDNGGVLLFESRAALAGYDPEGHPEVYRYSSTEGTLQCLSCNPTGSSATSGAHLQSLNKGFAEEEPLNSFDVVANLSPDGRRAFFESDEALVVGDVDGLKDVYEWEAQGVGSCTRLGGCVYLISSGHSLRHDYIFAVSSSGNDVFFRSSDQLLGLDTSETPSVYDARVGGGFSEAREEACAGESCRPILLSPPALPIPGSASSDESGNVSPACPKGKRLIRRNGKRRCVKKPHRHRRHHHSHRRTNSGKKGGPK